MAEKTNLQMDKLKAVRRVFALTLGLNLLVAFAKLFWGYQGGILSLTADGFHSLLDGASNIVGMVGLAFAMKPADPDHPYGHRKFEAAAAMIISFLIFLTVFEIAGHAFARFTAPEAAAPEIGPVAYAVVAITLAINLFVTWYEHRRGRELKNDLLLTDARHTLSDCLVSVSVLISLLAVQAGFVWADAVLALAVSLLILKLGFDIIQVHLGALMDEAVLDSGEVCKIVLAVPGVMGCHKIRSRGLRDHVFVDLHIQVDPELTVKAAHQISYTVESAIEQAFEGQISDVLVHIEEHEPPGAG